MCTTISLQRRQWHPLQYSCLENPMDEDPGRLQSMRSLRVGHDWATSLSLFTFMHWRRKWQPTPVFLPGEPQGLGSQWAAIYGVTQSHTRLKWFSITIVFLPKGKCLLISWVQSPTTVILETKKIKSATVSTFYLSVCHDVMGKDAMTFVFWMLNFKPAFSGDW